MAYDISARERPPVIQGFVNYFRYGFLGVRVTRAQVTGVAITASQDPWGTDYRCGVRVKFDAEDEEDIDFTVDYTQTDMRWIFCGLVSRTLRMPDYGCIVYS